MNDKSKDEGAEKIVGQTVKIPSGLYLMHLIKIGRENKKKLARCINFVMPLILLGMNIFDL